MARLLQLSGALLNALVLIDVIGTVLYARARGGLMSRLTARMTWQLFRAAGPLFGRRENTVLAFCGPTILIANVVSWGVCLTLGSGLLMYPALGAQISASNGGTSHDFMTALYAAGSSLAIVGSSEFSPHSSRWQLFYLFNSLVGISVVSLALTNLLQVYTALLRRNTYALTLHLAAGERNDGAVLLGGLGPEGDFAVGSNTLSNLAVEMVGVKEMHHFHPVLFYFRFREPFYSVSRLALLVLDTVALVHTALPDERFVSLRRSNSLEQLSRAALMLLTTLEDTFLGSLPPVQRLPDEQTLELWRRRFHAALDCLRDNGIPTIEDEQGGLEHYVRLRGQWDGRVSALGAAMGYRAVDIDPVIDGICNRSPDGICRP